MRLTVARLDENTPGALCALDAEGMSVLPCRVLLALEEHHLQVCIASSPPAAPLAGPVLAWKVPCLSTPSANDLLTRIAPLAGRIVHGNRPGTHGGTYKMRLVPDAAWALEALERTISRRLYAVQTVTHLCHLESVDVPALLDWITVDSDVADLEQACAQMRGLARGLESDDRPVSAAGMMGYLLAHRGRLRSAALAEIGQAGIDLDRAASELAAATARRDALVRRAYSWGQAPALLAAHSGLTTREIRTIVRRQPG